MLLHYFHTKFQPFQLLSLSIVLQHKLQRLKFSRHLVLTKHPKHMSKTDWSSPPTQTPFRPIPPTPWPILGDGKYFLPVADVRPFRLTHNPIQFVEKFHWLYLQYISRSWPLLFTSTTLTLVWPTIMSHLGYCNASFSILWSKPSHGLSGHWVQKKSP